MTAWDYNDRPSPNFDSREGHAVDMLVLHYTGMKTGAEAIERLCNRDAKVSAHYVVEEDGTILRLVGEDRRAWHAGLSSWRGFSNINQRSIGVEIVNPGHEFGYRPFPAAQMKMVAMLCRDILSRNTIPARNVVAHSDIAPARKEDPGELFEWKTLAGLGIGLWPSLSSSPLAGEGGERSESGEGIFNNKPPPLPNPLPQGERGLSLYGYDTTDLTKTIIAFQRHFRPSSLTGVWDDECTSLLGGLLCSI
jgi:N-acetylmuramoyl-L-alanine amidase